MAGIGLLSNEAAEKYTRENTVTKGKRKKLKGSPRVGLSQQLLPGIPDEITTDLVAPKLTWTEFHSLSSVSHAWQQAIQSRQIYEARVRSQSTQTLVVFSHKSGNTVRALALYSLHDNSFYQLPQFPGLDHNGELPWGCQCIAMRGKVYVLGGYNANEHGRLGLSTAAVYVLDLAAQQKWKQCASMQYPRSQFGSGVINGKIYVFGGITRDNDLVYGSEVYDPMSDSWSPIARMKYFGFCQQVITVGEELLVYNTYVYDESYFKRLNHPNDHSIGVPPVDIEGTYSSQMYDPVKNQWRIVHHIREDHIAMVTVGGKLYKMTEDGIDIYDISANSWSKPYQSLSFGGSFEAFLMAAVVVDDELLAMAAGGILTDNEHADQKTYGLVRNQGFVSQEREIVWRHVRCSLLSEENDDYPSLFAIHL